MPWLQNQNATASRTFTNIIHGRSNKFANWDPSSPISLGDYGTIDKLTAEFRKEGNIFNDSNLQNTSSVTTGPRSPIQDSAGDKYTVTSLDATEIEFPTTTDSETPGLPAETGVKARFKFTHRHGAMLLMSQPATYKLEHVEKLLSPENNDRLRHKHLVSEIVTCPAYALYLSDKSSEIVSVALRASAPASGAPAVAEASDGWYHEGDVGVFRCGSQAADDSFTPLYSTLEIVKNRVYRRELVMPPPETLGIDCWKDSLLPWKPLTLDGEEDESYVIKDDSDEDSDW